MKTKITILFAFAFLLFTGVVNGQGQSSPDFMNEGELVLGMKDIELDPDVPPRKTAELGSLLVVAPNPVENLATIKFRLEEDKNVTLRTFDVFGKEVYPAVNGTIAKGLNYSVSLDASDLAPGMYFVNISDAKGKGMTTRFIVTH